MVSVWGEKCQDCQKQKSEIFKLKRDKKFKHVLLDEHAREINEFLCCNDCSIMVNVLSDMRAFEEANGQMNDIQQQIYKVVKLFPFPKTIKGLKDILNDNILRYYVSIANCSDLSRLKRFLSKSTFPKIKHYYNNLYIENIYTDYFVKYGHRETFVEEINKKNIRFSPNVMLKKYIKHFVEYHFKRKNFYTHIGGKTIYQYPYHKYFKFCKIDEFNYDEFLRGIYRRTT